MRKNESLSAESARHAAAIALPGRLAAMLAKVKAANKSARQMLEARRRLENAGGEKSGRLEE